MEELTTERQGRTIQILEDTIATQRQEMVMAARNSEAAIDGEKESKALILTLTLTLTLL